MAPAVSTVGLVLTARDRFRYLAATLDDLGRCDLRDTTVMLVDDGSLWPRVRRILDNFTPPGLPVRRITRPPAAGSTLPRLLESALWSRFALRGSIYRHRARLARLPVVGVLFDHGRFFTVHEALRSGFDALLASDSSLRILVNIDSDVRLNPLWLPRLRALFERERERRGPLIATSFHAPAHPVLEDFPDYRVKQSIGGVNMLFDTELYRRVVRPSLEPLWDWRVVERMRHLGHPMICARPSGVQHVGTRGHFSAPGMTDTAPDFEP